MPERERAQSEKKKAAALEKEKAEKLDESQLATIVPKGWYVSEG